MAIPLMCPASRGLEGPAGAVGSCACVYDERRRPVCLAVVQMWVPCAPGLGQEASGTIEAAHRGQGPGAVGPWQRIEPEEVCGAWSQEEGGQ